MDHNTCSDASFCPQFAGFLGLSPLRSGEEDDSCLVRDENKLPPHLSSMPVKRQNWQVLNTMAYEVKGLPLCNVI